MALPLDWSIAGVPIEEKGCPKCGGDVAATPWRGWTSHCLKCGMMYSLRDFRQTTRRVIPDFDAIWVKGGGYHQFVPMGDSYENKALNTSASKGR